MTRDECRQIVLTRDTVCRGYGLTSVRCQQRPTQVHELGRGPWRRFTKIEPDACLGLCQPCHDWINGHGPEAIDLGLAWSMGQAERWLRSRGLLKPTPWQS